MSEGRARTQPSTQFAPGLTKGAPTPYSKPNSWWPYLAPFFAFLAIAQIPLANSIVPPWGTLILRILIPTGLFLVFAVRGAYLELFRCSWHIRLGDVLVGIVGAAIWVVPYLTCSFESLPASLDFLVPDRDSGLDTLISGPEQLAALLTLRALGFVFVVPVVEELFVRSFLLRLLQERDLNRPFHDIPIGTLTKWSLTLTTLVFVLGHAPWELWVAIPWFVVTSFWLRHRGTLPAVIVAHSVTNATIFAIVVGASPPYGSEGSLWFFL